MPRGVYHSRSAASRDRTRCATLRTHVIAASSGARCLVPKYALLTRKNFRRPSFFSCMQEQRLYSSKGELASRNSKARVTFGGREKKIEHFIPSSPNSFSSNSHLQKKSRKTDALALGCRHVLYGVRRNLRH